MSFMKMPFVLLTVLVGFFSLSSCLSQNTEAQSEMISKPTDSTGKDEQANATALSGADLTLDTALYQQKMIQMLNGDSSGKWPVKAPMPLPGAILPFKTVIAFY